MTEPGKELLVIAERILGRRQHPQTGSTFANRDSGRLLVATTHPGALCPAPVVKAFREQFPWCSWSYARAARKEIVRLVQTGEVDIGISSEQLDKSEGVVAFPYYRWHHNIVVPEQHPLTAERELTLAGPGPLVSSPTRPASPVGAGGRGLCRGGRSAADPAGTARDSDVIKTYVELEMGWAYWRTWRSGPPAGQGVGAAGR